MRSLVGTVRRALNKMPVAYSGSRDLAIPLMGPSGSEAFMRAMGMNGTLFAIVNRTSTSTAKVEWDLWRKAASGRDEDRVRVPSHAALNTWNKPNGWYTRQELVESGQQHIDLTGEGWLVVERDERIRSAGPLGLWPVRPDRIAPVPGRDKFITGYVYTGPEGEKVPLAVDEVLMIRMPNPLDPYRGMGPVQAILTDLDAARYSAEWNRNFFVNSAEPGGVIEYPESLDDTAFQEFMLRWREQHRGVAAAHRVALLEKGMKWVERKFSMRDMQFAELRRVSREVIWEAFGIPKFALGIVDDVNRATADASANWFAENLTVPRLDRWKGMLNNDYLPLFGATSAGLEFDYRSPVKVDRELETAEMSAKAVAAKTYIVDCGFQPAEVLELLDLPDMELAPKPEPPALPAPGAEPGTPPAAAPPVARIELVLPFDQPGSTTRPMTRRARPGRKS